ncbi:hypothetical protein L484_011350 [Morus notabilis]|uniref:Uncharacterized protein n=1 Tax=Morus notabilis TaxID=981085 RepID=W9S8A4_9ROSA|nr:hypothetical protein L484_011350 [Morus notabilis]
MIPPELQPRSFRSYISSSAIAPSFSSTPSFNNISSDPNPNPSDVDPSSRRSINNTFCFSLAISFFAHNTHIVVALLPCAAFLLDLGGTPTVTTPTMGLMISYILDSLNFKFGALVRVWLSLLFSQIAFFISSFSSLSSSFNSLPLSFLAAISTVSFSVTSSYYLMAFNCLFYWL